MENSEAFVQQLFLGIESKHNSNSINNLKTIDNKTSAIDRL